MHKWLEREGFANLSQRWNDACMAIEGDIVTTKVACVFKEQVEAAIKTCGLTGKVSALGTTDSIVHVTVETLEVHIMAELASDLLLSTSAALRSGRDGVSLNFSVVWLHSQGRFQLPLAAVIPTGRA
ncbi:hypothetical protein P4O66_008119, partial [Electrophorus voltai]